MTEGFPRFIGRAGQIRHIQSLLDSKETHVLLISGGGGIGKSHLLGELCRRLGAGELGIRSSVRHTQVINLDDTALRVPLTLKQRIAEQIAPAAFKVFSDLRVAHIRAQIEQQPLAQARRIRQEADEAFLHAFNRLAPSGYRMLVLLDTVESVVGTGMWDHFRQDVFPRLQNTLVVLAGRDLEQVVQPQLEWELRSNENSVVAAVELMSLPPFAPTETDVYLEAPEIGLRLGPEFQRKLHLLTDGHPILIALAVEWLRRGLILPEFIDESVADLQTLKSGERAGELDGRFRQALVQTTLKLQEPRDKVFLVMAYAHRRMDTDLLARLVGQPIPGSLVEELLGLPFVKSKPDGSFVLHDEMQRLLAKYAWPQYDKFGLEKQRLNRIILDYYDETITKLKSQMERARRILAAATREAGPRLETDQIVGSFNFLAENEADLWTLGAERLSYALRADLDEGISYFISEFDAATDAYISYRELLWEEIQPRVEELQGVRRYEVELRGARHLRNKGLFGEACDAASRLMDLVQGDSDREIEVQVFWGNCLLRIPGQLRKAIEVLGAARELAVQTGNQSREGQAVGTLGLVMRRAGRWDEAREYYRQAVALCQKTGADWDLALAFNNLGYVEALRGRYERSLLLIEDALRIYKALEDTFMVGVCCSTLGEASRYARTGYEETMACYDRALDVFEEQRHTEWLSQVYQQKAIAEIQLGAPPDLERAWKLVTRSLDLCRAGNPAGLPSALNRAGRIAEARAKWTEAERLFREGVERAEEADDVWFVIANLVHLAELTYSRDRGQPPASLRDDLSEIESYSARVSGYGEDWYEFPDLYGRMDRILGHLKYDLALGSDDQRLLDQAIGHYGAAYPQIARGFYASHGVRALPQELQDLRTRIDRLPPETAWAWCQRLNDAWGDLIEMPSFPSFVAACSATTRTRLATGEVRSGKD
jgi:tetratricopeptide (TPR) repeat protein